MVVWQHWMQNAILAPKECNPQPLKGCKKFIFIMSDLLTISLNNVRFRAYHGLFPDERQKGNDFVVNMEVSYTPKSGTILSLEDTIDYATLFEIIHSTMQQPVDLLETVAQAIAQHSYKQFPRIKVITVSIEKLNPPIDKFSGTVGVKYSKEY